MLQDFPRAVCVTRLTYRRDEELRAMLSGGATAAPNPAPVPAAPAEAGAHRTAPGNDASAEPQRAYDGKRATPHFKGKWYYELRVDYARALAIEPTLVIAGAMADGQMTGSMLAVRSGDANRSPDVMGVAIDLDEGKLYTSMNGDWGANIPGSNHGADLKLGRSYGAAFLTGSERHNEYLAAGAIQPNFGDAPMTYALPAGYRPWRSAAPN